MAATLTPIPTCEPANMSANEAEPDLKPDVAELSMLLPITSRLVDAAFRPLTAWLKLMVCSVCVCDHYVKVRKIGDVLLALFPLTRGEEQNQPSFSSHLLREKRLSICYKICRTLASVVVPRTPKSSTAPEESLVTPLTSA